MAEPATPLPKWALLAGGVVTSVYLVWSFWLALGMPIDLWDGYDYLVNARLLAGHDLGRLAQQYRTDRPPGISLLVAPLIALGYQPGQRGLVSLLHLVPWSLGLGTLVLLYRWSRRSISPLLAFTAVVVVALNPLVLHYLPLVMADVASMAFGLATLFLSVRTAETRSWKLVPALAVATGFTILMKYPMGLIGLTVPVANALWAFTGEGRPAATKHKLLEVVNPRLATGLLGGLALFFGAHALIYSTVTHGPGTWSERMLAGLKNAWAGGGGPGNTDPWWELPSALLWTFGVPVAALALVGLVLVFVRDRDRAGLQHASWSLGMMALFVFVIGHKESRYVIPALPSVAWLAARGATLFKRPLIEVVAAGLMVLGVAPPAWAELARMSDPLYTRPSLLAWARFALDRAAPDRPIIQHPNISPFALYPKNPVVFANDEYWHYHHVNHGGLEWYFDRRLLAFEAQPGPPSVNTDSPWIHVRVPAEWFQRLGEDALFLVALPKGAVIVRPPQGWFETASAPSQPEPPAPFVAIDLTRVTLAVTTRTEQTATFSNGTFSVELERGADGWHMKNGPPGSRWFIGFAAQNPTRWAEPAAELPDTLDGLWTEERTFPVRP